MTPGLQALAIVALLGLGACVGSVAAIAPPLMPGVVIVPDGVAIATPHPVKLFEGDPEGRWIALCQARTDTVASARPGAWRQGTVDSHRAGGGRL